MASTVETDESRPSNSGYLPASSPALSGEPYSPQLDPPSTNISSASGLTDAIKIQEPAWAKLRSSLCDLRDSSGEFAAGLASATRLLLEYFDVIEKAARKQKDYISLAEELNTTVGVLIQYIKASMSSMDNIFNITTRIKQQAEEIKKAINRGAIRRLVVVNKDKDTVDSYRKVLSLFQRLQEILNSIINDHLMALNPVHYAAYDSLFSTGLRRACTEGTCSEVLSNLEKWQHDPNGPAVYWINGMLGTGKTTIAYTLSGSLERRKQLAASFFCTRNIPDCRTVTRIIPTIAYQLARNFAPFHFSLRGALADEPELDSLTIPEQFERLLRDPLQEAKHIIPGSLVIVIDDLHECEDLDGVETFLYLLLRYVNELHIKFVVTSRPVLEIYRFVRQYAYDELVPRVIQHEMDPFSAEADIKLYLREELSLMSPTDSQIEQLAQRANYLFLNAALLVRYILGERSVDHRQRLQKLLLWISESTEEPDSDEMDVLYRAILKLALEKTQMEENETNDVMLVLRTVLLAQEPISVETIAALTGLEDSLRVRFALQPLQIVLVQPEETTLILIRDSSFSNFLLSSERSGQYSCDVAEHSCLLVEGCFKVMKRQLQFNICELVSSFVPDKVNDIQERIEQKISATLAYACCFWADHFVNSTIDNVPAILDDFLNNHLLFWAEVLNLRQELCIGVAALLKAKKQLELLGYTSSRELVTLVDDALSFVQQFAAGSSVQPTLYLYASLIHLCPHSSMVYKIYSKYIRGWFELGDHGNIAEHVGVANLDLLNSSVGSGVLSVAYSSDGARVVIGCENGTISIHGAHDGSLLAGPLSAHTDWVRCVAFSPNGARIISASSDCTIRMWDAISGASIASSFKGHDHPVKSVSFSADGRRIVSGSWDNTVRIWNAEDGMPVMEPFEGHKWGVNCVAFSPDSKLVASGSNDHTVRIWNISYETLVPATTVFNGHTGSIMSVGFTSNTKKLISGSVDCTICVWDILSGSLLTRLVQACNHLVYAVVVSPGGLYIASGSADSSINVWNIDNGRLAAGPFVGHSSGVRALAFSPDGTRVVSGSQDKTLRIWDVWSEGRHSVPNSSPIQHIPSHPVAKASGANNSSHTSVALGSPVFQKYTIRVWTLNRKELDLFSFRSPTQASITSFAWPLVCPHTITNLHSYNKNGKPINALPDHDSVHKH
ncbi:putative WD repeat-containing protein alr2800 [Nostoc sp, PCC 7120] [Rhizoctonia solani]|uniref:Putative WD repeat-containing protein alr2800 [Nostoc sp, PCC 7120] n=1 Tax=Rhizoctonia solani TaxID=456999 RepID=A0A0K6G588_9AGAM|nr:putative WD repeat-containing protein alr2800 [Nostoc sp, PCC 7120] [Rhizoctonia solani]